MRTFIKNNYLVTLDTIDVLHPCTKCPYYCICGNATIRVPNKLLQIINMCITTSFKYVSSTNFYIKNIASANYYKLIL